MTASTVSPPTTFAAAEAYIRDFPAHSARALQAGRMVQELGLGQDAVVAAMLYPLIESGALPQAWIDPPHPDLPWRLLKGLDRLRMMDDLAPSQAAVAPDVQL